MQTTPKSIPHRERSRVDHTLIGVLRSPANRPLLLLMAAAVLLGGCAVVGTVPASGGIVLLVGLLLALAGCGDADKKIRNAAVGDSGDSAGIRKGLTISGASVMEGAGSVDFTVTLAVGLPETVTVDYATVDGTAEDENGGNDYAASSGTLSFAPGDTVRTVTVTLVDDAVNEADESFTVVLSNAVNSMINPTAAIATATITDDDTVPALSIADVAAGEASGVATFTVSMSGPTDATVTVYYATADGTAQDQSGDNDYVSASGTLSFAPGETAQTVTVTLNDDAVFELGDYFTVALSNAMGATIAAASAQGRILNDDPTLELSALDGTNGFALDGLAAGDYSGWSVASAGDVNGDGFDDVIIGAYRAGSASGASYVVFGAASGFGATLALSILDGTDGFAINGIAANDYAGFSVASAGDVNGDGFDDVIIGAYQATAGGNTKAGVSYVIFGKASGFAATLDLSALDGTNGFAINGVAVDDFSGFSVSSAGDVNGDGIDDVIIGARGADVNGSGSGASYVVFGNAVGFAAALDLSALDGTNGFTVKGAAMNDNCGNKVSGAGDVDGDSFDDVIVGAYLADPNGSASGASYMIFGKADWSSTSVVDLATPLDGTNGFTVNGAATLDFSGKSVSGAGDVNGDGFDDVIVGAYKADPNGSASGASYLIFGKADWSGTTVLDMLTPLDGTDGFTINGAATNDFSGKSVSGAGDVNGDGFDDVIIGAPFSSPNGAYSGTSYVVFGKASGFPANLALSTLDGTNGFTVNGAAMSDAFGYAVSGGGDINGDGFDDVIVGAYESDLNGSNSGTSYVVFGGF